MQQSTSNLCVGLWHSRDTQLVRFCPANCFKSQRGLPRVDLQLGALHGVGRGWCGRDRARGHLVASRHHWSGPGWRRAGLPARAEGDIAGSVGHQGAHGHRASAGGQMRPWGLRTSGGWAVNLVCHVILHQNYDYRIVEYCTYSSGALRTFLDMRNNGF